MMVNANVRRIYRSAPISTSRIQDYMVLKFSKIHVERNEDTLQRVTL